MAAVLQCAARAACMKCVVLMFSMCPGAASASLVFGPCSARRQHQSGRLGPKSTAHARLLSLASLSPFSVILIAAERIGLTHPICLHFWRTLHTPSQQRRFARGWLRLLLGTRCGGERKFLAGHRVVEGLEGLSPSTHGSTSSSSSSSSSSSVRVLRLPLRSCFARGVYLLLDRHGLERGRNRAAGSLLAL